MPATPDLTGAERPALVALLRQVIDADPFQMAPHVRLLRDILDKLQPRPAGPKPQRAPMRAGTPSLLLARKKGRRR